MTLLFISSRDVTNKSFGGSQATNRNYLSLCEILGIENVEVFNVSPDLKLSLKDRLKKWINYLSGFDEGLSRMKIREIIVQSRNKDYIFIDNSKYGVIAHYLRKENYTGKIFCFFHNVEYNITYQTLKIKPLTIWRLLLVFFNEKKAVKYSDKTIVLNQRDNLELNRRYGQCDTMIIPISMADSFKEHKKELTSIPPTFLFIGNNWYANLHGIKWFVNNILEHVNIKLQIVGTGMDIYKKDFVHPRIDFLGYVPDLSTVLVDADYVVSPIFTGSGMKVKTCESLMYGKNIIGTTEAFEGYELDKGKVGAICNSKEEFIRAINSLSSVKRDRFNEYSRKSFLEKYSFQATMKDFLLLFQNEMH